MATKTSVKSGLWSATDTWDSGIPADGDTVVIASGHVVEYDYDMSAWVTGVAGLTITGTLSLTRTAGTYKLFIKASSTIRGAGTFDCGTSASPIPFAAKHTITGGTGWYINGASGLTFTCYAAEPVYKYIKLLNSESAGSTVLEVDTDVTDDLWSDGDTIVISTNDASVDVATIAAGGIASGSITITSGLSYAHVAGNYVILRNRNVNILGTDSGYLLSGLGTNKLMVGGGAITNLGARVIYGASGEISGGVFYGNGEGITAFDGSLVSGGVFLGVTTSSGYATGMHFRMCNNLRITGGLFACQRDMFSQGSNGITILGGLFVQTIMGFESCSNLSIFGGEFVGGQRFVTNISLTVKNATVRSKSHTMYNSGFTAFNTLFAGNESSFYAKLPREIYSESIDHNQVLGAYKAWTTGGVTTLQTSVKPVGYANSMQTVLENAAVEGYWQKEITITAGASVNIALNLRKDASMTYLPRIVIFNKASTDPFAGGTPLKTFMMTNSIDTWEADSYTYTNNGTADVTLIIRCQGMNATGNMYSALDIEVINVDLTAALAKLTAIQAKTDQLMFTVPNQVDANALTGGTSPEDIRIEMDTNSTKLASIKEDLDNPDQYKADVSSLAKTTHLQEIEDKVDAIKLKTDNIPANPATAGEYTASLAAIQADLDDPAQYQADVSGIPDAILAKVIVDTLTVEQVLKVLAAVETGVTTGGGTDTIVYTGKDGTEIRLTGVDEDGNRSTVIVIPGA